MTEDAIEVYAVGSTVLLGDVISAQVVTVEISENGVRYECVWWDDRTRNLEWLNAWEVRPDNDKARITRVHPII